MLDKCLLYTVYNSGSPLAFLEFISHMYFIVKSQAVRIMGNVSDDELRNGLLDYYTKHNLHDVPVGMLSEEYRYSVVHIGDLLCSLNNLSTDDVMSYVRFFGLDITKESIKDKRWEQMMYLKGLGDVFGYAPKDVLDSADWRLREFELELIKER